jgi:hypothetical protein
MPTRTRVHNASLIGIVLFVGLAILLVGLLVGLLAPHRENTTPQNNATPAASIVLPLVQLEGQWFAKDGENTFVGTVTGDSIEIQLSLGGDMSALYWHGTFRTAEAAGNKIVSSKTEQPDEIVLSQDSTKEFLVNQNELVFKFSALGFTKNIAMTR